MRLKFLKKIYFFFFFATTITTSAGQARSDTTNDFILVLLQLIRYLPLTTYLTYILIHLTLDPLDLI